MTPETLKGYLQVLLPLLPIPVGRMASRRKAAMVSAVTFVVCAVILSIVVAPRSVPLFLALLLALLIVSYIISKVLAQYYYGIEMWMKNSQHMALLEWIPKYCSVLLNCVGKH